MQMIFFKYENQREPPSLSDRGKLRSGTKSDILSCLPGMPGPGRTPAAREASVVVLDMAAVIHIIKPQRASVFGEYTEMQLLPYDGRNNKSRCNQGHTKGYPRTVDSDVVVLATHFFHVLGLSEL